MARLEQEDSMMLHNSEKQPVVHQLQPVTPWYNKSVCQMTDMVWKYKKIQYAHAHVYVCVRAEKEIMG